MTRQHLAALVAYAAVVILASSLLATHAPGVTA